MGCRERPAAGFRGRQALQMAEENWPGRVKLPPWCISEASIRSAS